MSGAHDDLRSAEVEEDAAVDDYDSPDEDEKSRESNEPLFRPANFDFPPEVGSGIGKLPPFNPDAEEPARHIYAKAHLVSKQRLEKRLPPGTKTITPEMVARIKQEGNEAVEQKKWELAQSRYEDACALMLRDVYDAERGILKGEFADNKDALAMMNACYFNSAMCLLKHADEQTHTEVKQSLWKRAEYHCIVGMANQGRPLKAGIGAKAFFRRGKARQHLRKWPNAIADFKQAVKFDPRNREIRKALDECIKARDKEKMEERQFYSFDKMKKALETKEAKEKDEAHGEIWSNARMYAIKGQQADVFAQTMGGADLKPISVMDDDVD